MSQTELLNFNPPRYTCEPVQPLPQTCLGTLEHSGLPGSDPVNITDIAPDFSWMSQYQHYLGMFSYKSTSPLRTPVYQIDVMGVDELKAAASLIHPWAHLPFFTSKYWNGMVSFKFIAIKPPRTTGKLLIRYKFSNKSTFDDEAPDSLRRGVVKEWDLGQSNEFEFDITHFNAIQSKMTWVPRSQIPEYLNSYQSAVVFPIYSSYGFGQISVEPAQKYQPGGIFPDDVRIQVFRVFKNAQFYIPTDPRSNQLHALSMGMTMIAPGDSFDDQP